MIWMKQFEFRLLWPFYASQMMRAIFALTAAYWVVYFLSLGHSLAHVSLLPTVMLFSSLALQLPAGLLADLHGRKRMVVTALFCDAVVMALIPFFGNRFEFLLALYILMGVGTALASGTTEAWVVDVLHWHEKQDAIPKFFAILHSFINIGFIVAPLLASVIFFFTGAMHYLWWMEGVMLFAAGAVLAIFAREKRMGHDDSPTTAGRLWRATITEFRTRPMLALLALLLFIFAMIFGLTSLAWQPFLMAKGISLIWFGVLFGLTGLLAIVYPLIQTHVNARINSRRLLQSISFIQMLVFFLLAMTPVVGVIALFIIFQNLDSIKFPIFQPWLQKHMPSAVRSTIGSAMAVVGAVGEGVGYLVAGQLAQTISVNAVWWFAGCVSAIAIFVLIRMRCLSNNL